MLSCDCRRRCLINIQQKTYLSSATKLSNSLPTSKADRAKSKMSSANRKSMRCGIPSDKSKPRSPTFSLHFRIANCNTAQKRRGLKTHPGRTPPFWLKLPCSSLPAQVCLPVYVCAFRSFLQYGDAHRQPLKSMGQNG